MDIKEFSLFYINKQPFFLSWLKRNMPKVKHEDCEDAIADTFFSLKKVVESGKQIDNMEEYCKRAIKNRLLRIIGKQKYAINIDLSLIHI